VRTIDAEISLLVGLARHASAELAAARAERAKRTPSGPGESPSGDGAAPAFAYDEDDGGPPMLADVALGEPADAAPDPISAPAHPVTLVLRAGREDTLVLALDGDTLCHYGPLASLTAFEPAETICSRVLLQQDAHGLGEVGRVLVLSDHAEAELTHYLSMFFPEAQVHSVREMLPPELRGGAHDEVDSGFVLAYAAARHLSTGHGYPSVNLLPPTLRRRSLALPYSWHVYALILLIAATAFFFSGRYVIQESELADRRAQVALLAPETVNATAAQLQAQIDSVQTATMGYLTALETLDSLLVGSDRWSRTLEAVSAAAKTTPGLWIESWAHDGPMTSLTLSGTATQRDAVVAFADRAGGDIATLSFADVRDFPVYSFTLNVPIERRLPDAAAYLRAQADSAAAAATFDRVALTASPIAASL
jgi:voltage-gated potassium channel Kch